MEKIKRDIAIIKYRKLPLFAYDEEKDTEVFYYPKLISNYWIKLENDKDLIIEIINLIENLAFKKMIFMNGSNLKWISKYTKNRKDYKPLLKTLEYFKSLNVAENFNGALKVNFDELHNFLKNYYKITQFDGGFLHYHFMDNKENMLFYLHYSGEIQIITLNKKYDIKFRDLIKNTKFIDCHRENTGRI